MVAGVMLKQLAIAAVLSVPVFAQTHTPVVHVEQLDELQKISAARYSSMLIFPLPAI